MPHPRVPRASPPLASASAATTGATAASPLSPPASLRPVNPTASPSVAPASDSTWASSESDSDSHHSVCHCPHSPISPSTAPLDSDLPVEDDDAGPVSSVALEEPVMTMTPLLTSSGITGLVERARTVISRYLMACCYLCHWHRSWRRRLSEATRSVFTTLPAHAWSGMWNIRSHRRAGCSRSCTTLGPPLNG